MDGDTGMNDDTGRETSAEARIRSLEAQVAELTAMVGRLTAPVAETLGDRADVGSASSRRRLLRNMAIVAGGAVAATVATGALPAAAAGPPLTLGDTTNSTTGFTRADCTASSGGVAFLFQTPPAAPVPGFANVPSVYPSALAGWSERPEIPHGVYGYSNVGGFGVVGFGSDGNATGILARGSRANLLAFPSGDPAPARTDTHLLGELVEDNAGNLWSCVVAGTPGTWRKLAGPDTAGSFHALTPGRVYDSRVAAPGPRGRLANTENRTVSVADRRSPTTGAITAAGFVPAGATAVVCNITVAGTVNAGFLTINPGGTLTVGASAITWSDTGQILSNGATLAVNANRELSVICGGTTPAGPGATDFLVDVTGYYL